MGKYYGAVVTTAGQNVIAQAITGTELTWTVMRTSSVAIPQGTDLTTLTSLSGIEQTSNITDASVYGNNVIQLSSRFSNTGIATVYYIQTVGIYGQLAGGAETLIAVMTAVTPDEMPVYDPDAPSAFIFNSQITVQNAESVTMTVNDTGTATVADLNRKLDKTGDASDAKIGSSTASTASYPIPAVNDTFKVILGKIIKFFTDIKAAYTNVSVSGKKITFTTAAGDTKEITTQDTTYGVVSKTANGLAPQLPNETTTTKYLRQDGSWQVPPNTTYGLASTAADGLLRKLTGNASQWMRGDGTWQTAQNNLTTTAAGFVLDARMGKTLNDKLDVIGKISVGSMSSPKSCPANVWTAVASVNVSAGAYIVFGRAYCGPGNSGKMFSVAIGYASVVGAILNSVPVTINTAGFSASTADTFIVTGPTTFNVRVYPNSELTIGDANITAIRIK